MVSAPAESDPGSVRELVFASQIHTEPRASRPFRCCSRATDELASASRLLHRRTRDDLHLPDREVIAGPGRSSSCRAVSSTPRTSPSRCAGRTFTHPATPSTSRSRCGSNSATAPRSRAGAAASPASFAGGPRLCRCPPGPCSNLGRARRRRRGPFPQSPPRDRSSVVAWTLNPARRRASSAGTSHDAGRG